MSLCLCSGASLSQWDVLPDFLNLHIIQSSSRLRSARTPLGCLPTLPTADHPFSVLHPSFAHLTFHPAHLASTYLLAITLSVHPFLFLLSIHPFIFSLPIHHLSIHPSTFLPSFFLPFIHAPAHHCPFIHPPTPPIHHPSIFLSSHFFIFLSSYSSSIFPPSIPFSFHLPII